MLADERIPSAELREIRRHRDPEHPARVHPWLRDYQVAVDQGRGADAVAILREHRALKLYDTRAQSMGGMVEEWDSWRDRTAPSESVLIVHGPNSDVDLVCELAQRKRLEAGELGEQAVRAVDRDYLLRPGDVVQIRNAAYTFLAQPDRPRPRRVENGQIALIDAVDPERDTLTLLLREPGVAPRLVEIDQAWLRAERGAGRRAAAVRLAYAMHSFPAQGATVNGTATLAGHWSQAKRETYVGDTRAVYRHSVHVAREDLGLDGTDEDRLGRYAQRISENRRRQASIHSALDPTLRLATVLPDQKPIPGVAALPAPSGPPATLAKTSSDTSPTPAARAEQDMSDEAPAAAARDASTAQPTAAAAGAEATGTTEWLAKQLGPRPDERIARERWDREAQRLKALPGGRQQPSADQPGQPFSRAARPAARTRAGATTGAATGRNHDRSMSRWQTRVPARELRLVAKPVVSPTTPP
jgi:hypothetical protein